jgi:hypothetical protein
MRIRSTIFVAIFAVVLPGAARSHDGNGWFDSATATAADIVDRYPSVRSATCVPIPPAERAIYHAHADIRGSVRVWDHFLCKLSLERGGACNAVAHITGANWWQFQLTTYPKGGCTPTALERTRGSSGRPLFQDARFGITFEYTNAFTLIRRIAFDKSAGAHPVARAGLVLSKGDVITVSRYNLRVAITDTNLTDYKSEIDGVIGQLGHILAGPVRVRYGGLPGYAYRLELSHPEQGQTRMVILFAQDVEYLINCQSTPARRVAVESACKLLLETVHGRR